VTLQELEPRAQVLELARLVSPAVRVEPDRLRAVRLAFLPRSQASLESELWFSPLVQARNADGLVLRPDVIVVLREELVGDARVPELRAVHETVRRALPRLLAIEEEIVWLALARADDHVAGHLLSVLKTMMSHPDRALGLASWAARALGELPAAVRNTPAAIHLDVATCARLRRPIRVEALRAGPSPLALPDLLPPDLPTVQVAVERRGDRMLLFEILAEPREGAGIFDVPETDPVILVMTSGGVTDVVTLQPGERRMTPAHGDTVTLRTLHGDEWELARRPVVHAAPARRAFSWIHLSSLLIRDRDAEQRRPMHALQRDLERMEDEVGEIGALFVTGDLTSRGSPGEFKLASRFLKQLVGHRIPVFIVPGNHDYDRSGHGWRRYEHWWHDRGFDKEVELHHGRVPGDFVATLRTDGMRVGIVGLNTARSGSASGSDSRHPIGPHGGGSGLGGSGATLDAGQIGELVPDLDAWSAAHDVTVLLTHHRRDVILEDTRLDFDRLVAPPGVFDVHLSAGGEWPEKLALGTTFQVRGISMQAVPAQAVLAGSRKTPPGYWLGRVEQGDARQARLWARAWNEEASSFEADPWIRIQIQDRDKSVTVPLMPRPLSRIPRFVAGEILERLGRGSSLLLYGPPGAGKTTLLDDLAQRLPATRRASADDDDTLDLLRREHDAGTTVIWLVDDLDRVPEAQRLALFEVFSPEPGRHAGSTICFTARSFETHGGAPGIEPIAVPDVDEAELTALFARRLAALGTPRETAREIFHWAGGHIALAARIVEGLERDRHLPVAHIVERAILSPDSDPPLPSPEVSEAALDLYQALLRGEHVPRARDRATAELLASGLAIEAIGETGSDELHVRNRIIRQVYDQRWIDRALPAPPAG
jgi:hypothetical protein